MSVQLNPALLIVVTYETNQPVQKSPEREFFRIHLKKKDEEEEVC